MTSRGTRTLRWSRGILLVLLALTCVHAEDAPVYVKRLSLPIDDDGIGYPQGVAVDLQAGEVLVSDTRRNRILIFDRNGLFRFEIPGGRVFSSPSDVAVDAEGYLFVLANYQRHRALIELDFDGLFRHEIRLSGLPPEALLPTLSSLAISPQGDRLFLLDEANLTLWLTDRNGRIEGSVDLGEGLDEDARRDLILGKVDVYGDRVLVAVSNYGEIRTFDFDGYDKGTYGAKGTAACKTAFPTAAALDADGNLVIVDQQRMIILRWARKGNRCLSEHYGIGNAPGYLYFPADLALDAAGRLYVSQGFEGRVQAYQGFAPAATFEAEEGETEPDAPSPESAGDADDPEDATREAVERAVRKWARAWSDRRSEDYLEAYSLEFIPPDFGSREKWARAQRKRLRRSAAIDALVPQLEVRLLSAEIARATLVVVPRSNPGLRLMSRTLLLAREGAGWKIIEERVPKTS